MRKIVLGISLALVCPVIYTLIIAPIIIQPNSEEPFSSLLGFCFYWLLAGFILFFTIKIEELPLSSIGFKFLSGKMVLMAVGLGIVLSLLVPALTLVTEKIIPSSDSGSIAQVTANYPWWLLLISVLTAGITEEILFRGYSLERLMNISGSKNISGFLSLVFFVTAHAAGWNATHILGVVLPLGIILTGIYFWKRNILFVMIVHIFIDLPLVFMSFLA